MQEITEIFLDSAIQNQSMYLGVDNDDLSVTYGSKDSVCSRILSLSEVFTEWYLFDFSHEKDIQTFLNEEQIDDVFTESEFIDLMCGDAFIDDNLIQFIAMKTPFRLTLNKLHAMNQYVSNTNTSAYMIYGKSNIKDKLCELFK